MRVARRCGFSATPAVMWGSGNSRLRPSCRHTLGHIVRCRSCDALVPQKQLYLAVLPQTRFLRRHMHVSMTHARRKRRSVAAGLAETSLCTCLHAASVLRQSGDFSLSSSSGDKHHQRGPGEQPGDGGRGAGPRAGDPEDHRALLPSARLQRGRPPHQRPGRGAHECKRQLIHSIHYTLEALYRERISPKKSSYLMCLKLNRRSC